MSKLEPPAQNPQEDAALSDEEIRELDELKVESGESLLERWLKLAETALKKHPSKKPEGPQ